MTEPYREPNYLPEVEELLRDNRQLRAELDDIAAVPQLPWWVFRFDRWGDDPGGVVSCIMLFGGLLVLGASGTHAGVLCVSLETSAYATFWIWVLHLFIPLGLWIGYFWASATRFDAHKEPTLPKGWGVCRTDVARYVMGRAKDGKVREIGSRRTLEGALAAAQRIEGAVDL